jgi:hypothetical protein
MGGLVATVGLPELKAVRYDVSCHLHQIMLADGCTVVRNKKSRHLDHKPYMTVCCLSKLVLQLFKSQQGSNHDCLQLGEKSYDWGC